MQDKSGSSERIRAMTDIWPMPSRAPANFVPEIIIYRRMVVPSSGEPYYVDHDVPTLYEHTKFRRIVRAIAKGTYKPNSSDVPEDVALDITVRRDAYIILEATDDKGNRLAFNNPGIWLAKYNGQPYPANFCGALDYIDDDGDIHEDWRPDCHIVMFCAVFVAGSKKHPHIQSLAYDVDTGGNAGMVEALGLIDPDVRHPGNGGDDPEVGGN